MEDKVIDFNQLASNKLKRIFEGVDMERLDKMEKAFTVYRYLMKRTDYDEKKLEGLISGKHGNDIIQGCYYYFLLKKGTCESISYVYKWLLEKIGVDVKLVLCDDGNPRTHMLNIIEDEETGLWYFVDLTRGILYRDKESLDNFVYGYNRSIEVGQKMLGVMPDDYFYNYIFNKATDEKVDSSLLNEQGLYNLPPMAAESFSFTYSRRAL